MQLLRIASVLFILHICYHPRLYSAPIKEDSNINNGDISIPSSNVNEEEEETQTHSNDEHQAAVAEILNSTTFANITNSLLRSDSLNRTNPLDLTAKRSLPYLIWISIESWANYLVFKQETCRTVKEEIPRFEEQDFLENGYFKWEENEFHRELRVLLFPETSNTLKPLVDTGIIDKLDKRFLQKPLESYCYQKETKHTKEEEAAEEKSKFEDTVLNRAFPIPDNFRNVEKETNESVTTTTTVMMTFNETTNVPSLDDINSNNTTTSTSMFSTTILE